MKKAFKVLLAMLMVGFITCLSVGIGYNGAKIGAKAEETQEVEQTTEESEEGEKTPQKQGKIGTFEEFLEYTQSLAETYGYKEQYSKAVENIKHAITKKQFSIVVIGDILVLVSIVVSILKKSKREKRMEIVEQESKLLLKGVNDLIAETNKNTETNGAQVWKQTEFGESLKYISTAMRMFLTCIKLPEETKQAILNNFDRAVNVIDGVTTSADEKSVDEETESEDKDE